MKKANDKIDFVILWVDGNDPEWLKEKNKYSEKKEDISNNKNRFRDWNLLKYWFRGIEKNAPWVNKIHFVTWGHIPEWLNKNHPKINIVKHEDFIPKEYLPTFNSNVIQYYLNRIEGITNKFVMFDDDMFLIKPVKKTDFFVNNCIRDNYGESTIFISKLGDVYPHSLLNNMQCIFEHYSKKDYYRKNLKKIFSPKNGIKMNLRTLMTIGYKNFIGISNPHICQSYTQKHYNLFWKYCNDYLYNVSNNKFRNNDDLTTFLIRYIALLEGDFVPRNINFGKRIELSDNNEKIYKAIEKKKYNIICINDSNINIDFEKIQNNLQKCFNKILPDKCSFEK